jgi:hypothetical protein
MLQALVELVSLPETIDLNSNIANGTLFILGFSGIISELFFNES